jgi:hypothetical protein
VLPVAEVADSSLTSDGSEVSLFPEAAAKFARQQAGLDEDDLAPPGASKPFPWAIAIGSALVAIVIGFAIVRLRAGRRDHDGADIPAPPSTSGGFRG